MESLFKNDSVEFNESKDAVVIVDQTLFPWEEKLIVLENKEQVYEAIKKLRVRGAPAIGVAAAYGLYISVAKLPDDPMIFESEFISAKNYINSSRPTAVNLSYALERMYRCYLLHKNFPVPQIKAALYLEAVRIKEEDVRMCEQISENGATLITRKGMRILTHCNAGHYAVSRFGTALGPIYLAHSRGLEPIVYADETRPLMQGARITAYELQKAGIDVTLQCDNMVSSLMRAGKVDMVMLGCDRIAANGDVVNKIGTSGIAIMAKYYGIPFYSIGPTSTIDSSTPTGKEIVIEQRDGAEVTDVYFEKRIAPQGVKVYNPAFDVTPAELVTGIVTEKGIFRAPYDFSNLKLR